MEVWHMVWVAPFDVMSKVKAQLWQRRWFPATLPLPFPIIFGDSLVEEVSGYNHSNVGAFFTDLLCSLVKIRGVGICSIKNLLGRNCYRIVPKQSSQGPIAGWRHFCQEELEGGGVQGVLLRTFFGLHGVSWYALQEEIIWGVIVETLKKVTTVLLSMDCRSLIWSLVPLRRCR
jgi:hypothetical protein